MTTITVNTSVNLTLDESVGLQNLTATPTPAGDADDNDIAVSSLPTAFTGRLTALGLGAPTNGAALSGYTGTGAGSNIISVAPTPGGTITDLGLVGSDGAPLNGLDSGLDTLAGANILLYTDTNNNIVLGRAGAADGPVVFALYLEETGTPVSGAKMWSVQYAPLKNTDPTNPDDSLNLADKVFVSASEDLIFSLANAPSGQNLFLMFTTANPATVNDGGIIRITDPTIIATGRDPANQSTGVNITTGDTINSSQGGGTTTFGTNSQMITEQEGIRFSFVTGARQNVTIPNLDQNEADVEANIDFTAFFGAKSATFDIVQLQSGKSAQVKITAFSSDNVNGPGPGTEAGVNFVDGYADDTSVTISNVTVFNASGAAPAVAYNMDGSATITGVEAGDKITYTTTSDHNRVLIENGALTTATGNTHADFDIGGFKLLQASSTRAEVGSHVKFEDDGPSISTTGTEPTLTVDETVLATNDTKNFAANFTSAFGADGAGTLVYALGISATGADSGLVDTATGNHVFLFVNAGVVEGRAGTDATTAATGALVFTVSAAANGDVTLDQLRAVVHPDTTNPDDSKTLSADNLVTLTGTITDKDGDSRSAALNIGSNLVFKDDGPAVSANATVKLDDDALAGGNAGGTGDDINAENTSGTLGHSFGADGAGSIAYLTAGAPTGFTYEKSGDNLLVKQGTTTVLTLTLNTVTGAYAVTQNAPIMHAAGLDENNTAFTVNYQVTDKDGDTANGTLSVNVDDDTPTLDFGNLVGTGTILPQYGEWNGSVGADQPGNLDISLSQFQLVRPDNTTVNGSSFTFSELAGSPNAAGDYLFTGSLTADFDNNASTADTTNNFTLTAFHDGRYTFDLQQGFGSTITFSSANGSLGAGGPDPVQTLTIPPDEQVVFFGVQATTSNSNILSAITLGAPDLTEAQIEAANFSFISSQNMNVSNSGIGVGNNNLDGNTTAGIDAGDESFVVNPETLLTGMKVFIDNSVGGYDPATEELYYKIFFDDGTTSSNIKVVSGDLTAEAGGQKSFGINTEGSKLIDSVQLTMGKGTVKIPVIEFIQSSENLASDIKLDFTASLADADSDTATSNFSVDLFANDLPANSYTLLGATSDLDSFDVDLAASQVSYRVEGFDTPDDTLFLLGDSTATVSINNSGTDSIVSVAETTGGQTTVITVVGADLLTSNIVLV